MINKYFLAKMNIPAYLKKFLCDRYGYNEIEGIPPIIFKGNGKSLLDYRIFGANGGVGDRTENLFNKDTVTVNSFVVQNDATLSYSAASNTSDYIPIENTTAFTLSWLCEALASTNNRNVGVYDANKNAIETFQVAYYGKSSLKISLDTPNAAYIRFTIDKNMSNVMLNSGSTALPYEPYGYKVPVVINGKNLFDGIYGANHFSKIEPVKTITISTKSTGESSITFVYKKSDGTRFGYTRLLNENETSGSVTVTTPSEAVGIGIYAATDYTSQTIAYDTLIEYGDRATTYEPYHEPTTTNIYLDEPIEENESISLSDTNVNIPTIKGTNVLTVDTTVQPSKVLIKVGG